MIEIKIRVFLVRQSKQANYLELFKNFVLLIKSSVLFKISLKLSIQVQ